MKVILSLPDDVSGCVLSVWLDMAAVANLDTALCNSARNKFLLSFSNQPISFSGTKEIQQTDDYFKWVLIRNIKVRNVVFSRNNFAGCRLRHNVDLSKVTNLTLDGEFNPFSPDICFEILILMCSELRSVRFHNLKDLTDDTLSNKIIQKSLQNLTSIDIESSQLTGQSIKYLATQCFQLQIVILTFHTESVEEKDMLKLIQNNARHLSVFNIHCMPFAKPPITILSQLVHSCPAIKSIIIKYDATMEYNPLPIPLTLLSDLLSIFYKLNEVVLEIEDTYVTYLHRDSELNFTGTNSLELSSYADTVTGDMLDLFKNVRNIQDLYITGYAPLTAELFQLICTSNKALNTVFIGDCDGTFTYQALKLLMNQCNITALSLHSEQSITNAELINALDRNAGNLYPSSVSSNNDALSVDEKSVLGVGADVNDITRNTSAAAEDVDSSSDSITPSDEAEYICSTLAKLDFRNNNNIDNPSLFAIILDHCYLVELTVNDCISVDEENLKQFVSQENEINEYRALYPLNLKYIRHV